MRHAELADLIAAVRSLTAARRPSNQAEATRAITTAAADLSSLWAGEETTWPRSRLLEERETVTSLRESCLRARARIESDRDRKGRMAEAATGELSAHYARSQSAMGGQVAALGEVVELLEARVEAIDRALRRLQDEA